MSSYFLLCTILFFHIIFDISLYIVNRFFISRNVTRNRIYLNQEDAQAEGSFKG